MLYIANLGHLIFKIFWGSGAWILLKIQHDIQLGKDLPKMLMFCDSFFRKTISIVLLSFIVIINQPRAWIV